jgi:hypothetical protein
MSYNIVPTVVQMIVPYLWMEFHMLSTTSLDTLTLDCFNISTHKPWYNMETLCEFEFFWNYHANISIDWYQSLNMTNID